VKITSRRRAVAAFAAVAAPVIVASAAFACQTLTTASVNPKSAPAGGTVTVTGQNYSTAASASQVQVRLDSRTGPLLASVTPAANRTVTATVQIPANTSAGYHTILLTQYNNTTGQPIAGTPGRTSLQVTGAASADSSSITPSALLTPLGLAGLALSGALVVRRRRHAAPVA
jgi:hypothetical protein